MQPEKVFAYIVLENKGHYQTYSNMKELLRSYELPVASLEDGEQLKLRLDQLHSHYNIPPQQRYAESFQGRRQELMEALAENNQDMSKFNQSMSHDLLAFARSYNSCVSNLLLSRDSQSPGCLRSMRDSMKHLLQEKQELEMEKETLEEIVIMSMKNHKAEVREGCAQRDKDNLQMNLQSVQELIGELRERNCYLEKKLKKRSLLKRVRGFFQKKNPLRVSRSHSSIQVVHWNQDMLDHRGDRETVNKARNSPGGLAKIDEDLEKITEDLLNIDADLENSEEDVENGEEDLENIDKSVYDKKEEKTPRTSKETEEGDPQRSGRQHFMRYMKPKKEKWPTRTPKTKSDMWRSIQSCIVPSQNSSVNNVQFQKLAASPSTERP